MTLFSLAYYRTFTNSTRINQTSQKLKNTNTFSGRLIIYFSKTVTGYMVWEQLPGFRSDERAVAGPAHHTATRLRRGAETI